MMFLIKIMSLLCHAAINNEPKIGVGTNARPHTQSSLEKRAEMKMAFADLLGKQSGENFSLSPINLLFNFHFNNPVD